MCIRDRAQSNVIEHAARERGVAMQIQLQLITDALDVVAFPVDVGILPTVVPVIDVLLVIRNDVVVVVRRGAARKRDGRRIRRAIDKDVVVDGDVARGRDLTIDHIDRARAQSHTDRTPVERRRRAVVAERRIGEPAAAIRRVDAGR